MPIHWVPSPLNIYSWPPLIAMFLSGGLAIFVFSRHSRSKVHRAFALWNLSVADWNLSVFLLYTLSDITTASHAARVLRDGLVFLYTLFFHFILLFIDDRSVRNRRLLQLSYATSLFFMVANHIPGWMVSGLRRNYWGYYPVAGRFDPLFFLIWNVTVWYSIMLLYRAGKTQVGFRRNQCQLLLLGTSIFFASLLSNFLVVQGLVVYPIGNVMTIVYVLILAYAILTYGLMDIQLAVERGLYYLTLGGALTGAYALIVAVLEHMFAQHDVNTAKLFRLAAVPLTLAATPRLKSVFDPIIDRMPWGPRHKAADIMREFGEKIVTILDMAKLSDALVLRLSQLFGVSEAALYMKAIHNPSLERQAGIGQCAQAAFAPEDPLMAYVLQHRQTILREPLLWEADLQSDSSLPKTFIETLRALPYVLYQPFFYRDQLIGLLCLGPKISGGIYDAEDLRLLDMLKSQIAVAISNARSIEKIAEQQRELDHHKQIATIGTVAMEMAHELAKPLTHIMNAGSRLDPLVEGAHRKNLRTIEREAQRAAEILDGFAMLSPERPLHRVAIPLANLIEEAITSLGLSADDRIRIVRQYETMTPLSVNPGQLVQVFTNLIQNAWQAILDQGVLTLSIRTVETQNGSPKVEICVCDTGIGIAEDIQEKIFEPFFTTKQEQGGRGMGLTISRAMVERHGGTIAIQSPVTAAGGTRVIVQLPIITAEEKSHAT